MNYLFTIEYSAFIKGIGSIISASIKETEGFPDVNQKDEILVCTPNGKKISTHVESFPMVNFKTPPGYLHYSIELPKDFKEIDELIKGTEVYKIA